MIQSELVMCCVKCASNDIFVEWCKDDWSMAKHQRAQYVQHQVGQVEVLHMHCRRCSYNWNEMPLDARKQADREALLAG